LKPFEPLPTIINLTQIKTDIHSQWLPVENLGVLFYRRWSERNEFESQNLILWLETTEITEQSYFKLLENFYPDGLDPEQQEEHSRLFNQRYKGLKYQLCEVSRQVLDTQCQKTCWETGQARRRVLFNKAYDHLPNNKDISDFIKSHWNDFYYELRKHPQKYRMHEDKVHHESWKSFNGEEPLKVLSL
jgi:hypothetical protein